MLWHRRYHEFYVLDQKLQEFHGNYVNYLLLQLLVLLSPCLAASATYTCASVTKQYNLLRAKVRWRCEAGKITVGLVTRWPYVTDLPAYKPNGLCKGDEHPAYAHLVSLALLYLYLLEDCTAHQLIIVPVLPVILLCYSELRAVWWLDWSAKD